MAISDIILDGPLPESLQASEGAYCACVSGAIPRGEYLAKMAAAGLTNVQVVLEADAAELLASDCCGGGLAKTALEGVVTSLSLTARKGE